MTTHMISANSNTTLTVKFNKAAEKKEPVYEDIGTYKVVWWIHEAQGSDNLFSATIVKEGKLEIIKLNEANHHYEIIG